MFQEQEYGAVVTVHVVPPAEIDTELTPRLLLAEAVIVAAPDTDAPFAGEVILTVGGVGEDVLEAGSTVM